MLTKYGFNTTAARSRLMSKIKSQNTLPEIKLRKYLWNLGFRYRLNVAKLPGKPDIVISKSKLIIFIDGEFWHGYKWNQKKNKIKANRNYWIPKIERNMKRDKKNNKNLRDDGWTVLRFWEHQLKNDFANSIKMILRNL